MRKDIRQLACQLERSGDRIDGIAPPMQTIGADIVRLARMATSIHLAESVQMHARSASDEPMRESRQ